MYLNILPNISRSAFWASVPLRTCSGPKYTENMDPTELTHPAILLSIRASRMAPTSLSLDLSSFA